VVSRTPACIHCRYVRSLANSVLGSTFFAREIFLAPACRLLKNSLAGVSRAGCSVTPLWSVYLMGLGRQEEEMLWAAAPSADSVSNSAYLLCARSASVMLRCYYSHALLRYYAHNRIKRSRATSYPERVALPPTPTLTLTSSAGNGCSSISRPCSCLCNAREVAPVVDRSSASAAALGCKSGGVMPCDNLP